MDKRDAQTGLRVKYDVKKVETGEAVNNCFVLRPDRDPAAVAALRTYALVTPNKALADDIIAWIGTSTADKSKLAKLLGVEEDEKWRYPGCAGLYRVHDGVREYWDENNGWLYCDCEEDLVRIIAHPEKIIRLPRLTMAEIAITQAVGAKWVSRNAIGQIRVDLWDVKPFKTSNEIYVAQGVDPIARVKVELFPSVKMGDLVEVLNG